MSRPAVRTLLLMAMTAMLLLTLAVPAMAHVTVRTDNDAPGGFAVYTVRVPTERDDASTTTVEVQLPEGMEAFSYKPVPDWDIEIGEGVITMTGGTIEPGQFQEFQFVARNPDEPGPLTFPSVQTYDSGEEVSWIGGEGSDTPAPVVEIVAAEDEAAESDDDSDSSPLGLFGLVAGLLGMAMGGVALARTGKA